MGQTISNFTTTSQVPAGTTVASFAENSQFPARVCHQCSGGHRPTTTGEPNSIEPETDFPETTSRLLENIACPYTTIHHSCSLKMPMILGSWSERLQRWFDYGEVFGGEDRDVEIRPVYHLHRSGSDYLIFVDDRGVEPPSFHARLTGRFQQRVPAPSPDRFHLQVRKEILYATIFLLSKGYRILRLNARSSLDDYQAKILLNCLISQNQHLVSYPEIDYHWLLNETI